LKKIALLFIFCVTLFGQIVGSDFLRIEKDKLRIIDETKFFGYLKSFDNVQIIAEYKEIVKPINLFGEAEMKLTEVVSYEQAFKNLRYIYSKLYLKEKAENIDNLAAKLKQKQASIISLLFSLQGKNYYDTDIIPIIFEYRKLDRKLLEFEIEKESLAKSKEVLINAIVKKKLRFDNSDIDLKSKMAEIQSKINELNRNSKLASSKERQEWSALKSSLISLQLKSYDMKADFFEKIKLLKKIKSSQNASEDKQKLKALLSKNYEPLYFEAATVAPSNNSLFDEYKKDAAAFGALKSDTELDSKVFERVFEAFDDSLPARTTGYFERAYLFFENALKTTIFVSNNIDINLKTIILAMFSLLLIYFIKVWATKKVIPAYFERAYNDGGHSAHIHFLVSKAANIAAYMLMFFVILGSFGLSLTNFAIIVSALSVGIGFGLQGVVSNFISGVILLFENSIKIGDILSLSDGKVGKVTSVNLRTTNIRTFDNIDLLIPNSLVFSGQIENMTRESSVLRRHVKFTVGYKTDINYLKKLLDAKTKTLMGDNFIEDTALLVEGYGDYGLNIEYRVMVDIKKRAPEVGDFLREFLDELIKNDIEIPYPKLEIIKNKGE